MPLDRQDWERLNEIREEMNNLLEEAENLVRMSGDKFEMNAAKAYWLAGMENYLGEGRLSSQLSGRSMEDTIKALEPDDDMDIDDEGEVDDMPLNERVAHEMTKDSIEQ